MNDSIQNKTHEGTVGRHRLALAPGDPAGIGYEIMLSALCRSELLAKAQFGGIVFVIYAHRALFEKARDRFAPSLALWPVNDASEALECERLYLIDSGLPVPNFKPGQLSAACAASAHRSLMQASDDVKRGIIDGICTGPIHKAAMRLAHISAIGHTEMLANVFGTPHAMTLFITRALRIFFYSRHLSLRQALDTLDIEGIVEFGIRMHEHMQSLGFKSPRLAMAALNPHAGDSGQFGDEETRILIPAATRLRTLGINMAEPIAADSVFAQAARGRFDAVLSLYHDQGHIAAKTYDFERTISMTLGLPCLRTSVDHGPALDIAWHGKAQSLSMETAIDALIDYFLLKKCPSSDIQP
ncbi:MAG: 4-hydroxythreonine-4-phosphate dehydrogenase PdxA [Proteobacteria bacterium]|nr:4-hydroxythreonine-4-phosphate dehydrogenase PdxA [Pseudomonadota bacterium]